MRQDEDITRAISAATIACVLAVMLMLILAAASCRTERTQARETATQTTAARVTKADTQATAQAASVFTWLASCDSAYSLAWADSIRTPDGAVIYNPHREQRAHRPRAQSQAATNENLVITKQTDVAETSESESEENITDEHNVVTLAHPMPWWPFVVPFVFVAVFVVRKYCFTNRVR